MANRNHTNGHTNSTGLDVVAEQEEGRVKDPDARYSNGHGRGRGWD